MHHMIYLPVCARTSEIPINDDYGYKNTNCIHDEREQEVFGD